jgi:hypothetical protein
MSTRHIMLTVQGQLGKTTLLNEIRECLPKKFRCSANWCSQTMDAERMAISWEVEAKPESTRIKPTIICLCGSTKFKAEFITANFKETMKGKIVLTVGWFNHTDGSIYTLTKDEKIMVDKLHFCKIDLADEVLILNVGGYIGESTKNELEYARQQKKQIRFLEKEE